MSQQIPEVWTEREGGERIQLERGEDGEIYWPEGVTSGWVELASLVDEDAPVTIVTRGAPEVLDT